MGENSRNLVTLIVVEEVCDFHSPQNGRRLICRAVIAEVKQTLCAKMAQIIHNNNNFLNYR
jgi:hypothetical protein